MQSPHSDIHVQPLHPSLYKTPAAARKAETDWTNFRRKQAGADLCQAQAQVSFLDEAELNLTVEYKIWVLLEKTYNHI